jgi:single-strand DNA-binding protein
MSVNRVTLVGRIGKDPEVKQVSDTFKVAKVSLATSEKFTSKGETVEVTEWHNVIAYNKTAELFEKYVNKGDLLYVEGKLKTRSWEKDGTKHYATEIIVDRIDFLTPKSTSQSTSSDHLAEAEKEARAEESKMQDTGQVPEVNESGLPF